MSAKLSIIFLVQSLDDAKNIQFELKKIFFDFTSSVVLNRTEFEQALQKVSPDLILADHQVAGINGIEALEVKQKFAPEPPFILVADSLGEDNAVAFMKRGMADYVRKDNLNQLGPRVQEALQGAAHREQNKKNQQQLRKKVTQLSKILDLSLDVICTLDQEGRFVTVGAASELVWAYMPEELMGRKAIELIEEADKSRTYRAIEGLRHGVAMVNFENRFIRKDGITVFLSWSVRWDAQEQLAYAVVRDKTKIKQVEEIMKRKEKRFRTLLQTSTDGLCLLSADGKIIERSPSALKILGLDPGQFSGNWRLDLVHSDDLLTVTRACAQIKENPNETLTIEFRFLLPDDRYIWLEGTLNNKLYEPAIEAIVFNFRDITERKTAELELRESEARLKKAQAIGHCGNWELNLITGQAEWSDELYRVFGIEAKQIQPNFETFVSFIHPEDRPGVLDLFGQAHLTLENGSARFRICPLYGGSLYVISEWQFELDANGQPVRIFGIQQDITQTKLAEIALTNSEARLKQAQVIGQMGNWELNIQNGQIIWSDELYHIYGLDRSSTIPSLEAFESILHPDDRSHALNYFKETTASFREGSTTFRIKRPNGQIRYAISEWQFEFDAQEKPVKIFGIVQDITERKLTDQALEKSEEKYRDLFNFSPIPMWLFDVHTLQFIDVNEAALIHYGYSKKEFLSMTLKDIRPQEDLDSLLELAVGFKEVRPFLEMVNHIKKNGEVIVVEINSKLVEVGGRKARLVLATDISERMRYLHAIQQQNAKLKEIAWTQSHVVRAPLARLMGLVNLLRTCDSEVIDAAELLKLIAFSAEELDAKIREIVQKTEAVKDQTH